MLPELTSPQVVPPCCPCNQRLFPVAQEAAFEHAGIYIYAVVAWSIRTIITHTSPRQTLPSVVSLSDLCCPVFSNVQLREISRLLDHETLLVGEME